MSDKYQPLEAWKKAWVFRHQDLPVSEEDLTQIKPLTEQAATDIWRAHISESANHYSDFDPKDWPNKNSTWQETGQWQDHWDSDQGQLPELLESFLNWDDETLIWFCYDSEQVIESRYSVFKRCWKNFLFFDDGPILIGKKRKQAVQFHQDGNFQLGLRQN